MPTYSNAHAKVKKLIFEVQFPGNWFEFDMIEMIFEALQSELFRFKFHSLGSKILKIPEFNLIKAIAPVPSFIWIFSIAPWPCSKVVSYPTFVVLPTIFFPNVRMWCLCVPELTFDI